MKLLTVVGARPQFIKAAPVSEAFEEAGIEQAIIHTGQHYDFAMSELLFQQLKIPAPVKFLNLGGGTHGKMTGDMLAAVEEILISDPPDALLVYGDTNSTLAGALAAAKLHIPVIHVEAGLRSFNKRMPEEVNRILTDHVSSLLFCSSEKGVEHLKFEGITKGVHISGDVMAAAAARARKSLENDSLRAGLHSSFENLPSDFHLMTLHRAENTDNEQRMRDIFSGVASSEHCIVMTTHPRTSKVIEKLGLEIPPNILCIPPVGYFEMCYLLEKCKSVLTDSGGLQKEAYWFGKPCLTLRDETEWVETVESGWNILAGANSKTIASCLGRKIDSPRPELYGDVNAGQRIANLISSEL